MCSSDLRSSLDHGRRKDCAFRDYKRTVRGEQCPISTSASPSPPRRPTGLPTPARPPPSSSSSGRCSPLPVGAREHQLPGEILIRAVGVRCTRRFAIVAQPGGPGSPGRVEQGITRLSVPMIVGPLVRQGPAGPVPPLNAAGDEATATEGLHTRPCDSKRTNHRSI